MKNHDDDDDDDEVDEDIDDELFFSGFQNSWMIWRMCQEPIIKPAQPEVVGG